MSEFSDPDASRNDQPLDEEHSDVIDEEQRKSMTMTRKRITCCTMKTCRILR